MRLVLATSNPHKLEEFQNLLPPTYQLLSLSAIHFTHDIEETETTFEGNALLKANTIWRYLQQHPHYNVHAVIADDSGLEVEALHGAPGVYSARYAGEPKNDAANNLKLLQALTNVHHREAQFRTVLALVTPIQTNCVSGIVKGSMAHQAAGKNGFGYDPLFIPDGYHLTFAQLTPSEKNKCSHRALAVKALLELLAPPTL